MLPTLLCSFLQVTHPQRSVLDTRYQESVVHNEMHLPLDHFVTIGTIVFFEKAKAAAISSGVCTSIRQLAARKTLARNGLFNLGIGIRSFQVRVKLLVMGFTVRATFMLYHISIITYVFP